MAASTFFLAELAEAPKGRCPEIRRAQRYLVATHGSVGGILDSYNVVREKRVSWHGHGAGRLSRDELDLLRAALIFTSSGLDACCQTLVRDSLPKLIELGGTAKTKFDLWLDSQSRQPSTPFVAALKDLDSRSRFISLYLDETTKASYQGTSDIKERVKDLLGIPNKSVSNAEVEKLAGFFIARNDIVHSLDYVDPNGPSTARHHRSPGDVAAECDSVLLLMSKLIAGTAAALK